MVQRGELAGKIVRFVIGRRGRGDQADPARQRRERAQQSERFQFAARGMGEFVAERELVGEEDGIQLGRLGREREIAVIGEVAQRLLRRGGMAPGRLVMAAAVDEEIEVKLACHGGSILSIWV